MCHVPSWIKHKKEVLFITDKDARREGWDLDDATGHSAIRTMFSIDNDEGVEGEGIHKTTPEVVLDAFKAGKFNRIASAGTVVINGVNIVIPLGTVKDIIIRGKARVTAPRLRIVDGELEVKSGSILKAPVLTTVGYGGGRGKIITPKLK